jgi:hypothetical protein
MMLSSPKLESGSEDDEPEVYNVIYNLDICDKHLLFKV